MTKRKAKTFLCIGGKFNGQEKTAAELYNKGYLQYNRSYSLRATRGYSAVYIHFSLLKGSYDN